MVCTHVAGVALGLQLDLCAERAAGACFQNVQGA